MEIIRDLQAMRAQAARWRAEGKTIGMVPTMGALHEGHLSLMRQARAANDILVVSVYVNPTQFGPEEDFDAYPRDLDGDAAKAASAGADLVFAPTDAAMYPEGFQTYVMPSPQMTNILCGVSRPIHFRGVCTVLAKLFSLIHPDRAYFGEKDIQQLAIVRRMVTDLNLGVEIVGCPIVREADGLAKSSRNVYMTPAERAAAPVLQQSLQMARERIAAGERNARAIREAMRAMIEATGLAEIDYLETLDFATFERVDEIRDNTLIAMAVAFGASRLLDNTVIRLEDA